MLAALSGCGGDDDNDNGATNNAMGGSTASGGAGGAGSSTGGSAGSSAGATAGGGSAGMQSTEPFTVEDGVCKPAAVAGPEPIYEIDNVFGHIGSMATHGDTLYFAESADFDDIPPRIAKLEGDGPPTTVVDGHASNLRVFGDTLYYVESDVLKSVDLAGASAAPVVLNTLTDMNVLEYDEQHVVYQDETNIYVVDVGAEDLTAAVTLHAADSIYSTAIAADTLYLSSRDGVYRLALDGTGLADVVPDDSFAFIGLITSDGTSLYFDDGDMLKVVPVAGGEPLTIGVAGADSLFYDTAAFARLLPAGGVIYWADDGESYGWTAVDGTRCGILGTHDAFFAGGAALATSYLFASGEASIYRVARPE